MTVETERMVKRGVAVAVLAGVLGAGAWLVATPSPLMPDTPAPRPALLSRSVPPPAAPTPSAGPAAPVLVVKRILTVPTPFRHGDYVWDEEGIAPGPLIVTVDLTAQTVSVFRGGHEIGAAVMVYGADAKPTPLGVYPITQKDADHVSNIYHAPMPYMLRLTDDGVSIHASEVEDGTMTHGCIGVPVPFAKKLFAAAKLGDRVIVTRGERLGLGAPITAG